MVFIANLGNILIISIIIIATVLIILIIIEKKLYRKINRGCNRRNTFYVKRIENIKKTNIKNTLTQIDQIAKDFFAEAFGTKNTEDYSKLEDFFKQRNNLEVAEFCKLMNLALYAGGKITKKESQKLVPFLRGIVKKNLIATKYELRKLQEPKKTGILDYLKKVEISCIGKKKIDDKQDNSKQN